MAIPEHSDRGPSGDETLRFALLILVIGIGLGIAYNALGLASRPARGLPWVGHATSVQSLESLESLPDATPAAASTRAPTTTPAPSGTGAQAAKTPPSHPDSTARAATPARGTRSPSKTPAAPPRHAAVTTPAPITAPPPAATPPAAMPPAAPATAPRTADLPVIPDVSGPLKLEIATLRRLYDADAALIIDARDSEDYKDGHIAGAIGLSYNDALAEPDRVKRLDSGGRPFVLYCSGGDCELSMDLAKVLVAAGKRKVLVYEGGFPEWQAAGNPVAKGPDPGARP
jgi:rhodanese-related sulfurtransferase